MGRPLDIWSVGCVVVEMATGKLPWPEYDNQYQIMFQIGMGRAPSVPPSAHLPDEGHDFLAHCFRARPEALLAMVRRARAASRPRVRPCRQRPSSSLSKRLE